MKTIILALVLITAAAAARAQAPAAHPEVSADEEKSVTVTPKDKFILGNQHYRSNDASVSIDLPYDLGVNADYTFYQSDASSFTQIFTIGGSGSWGLADFSGSYTWNPLQNDSENHSFDAQTSVHTDSKDFRTTLGVEGSITDNFQYLRFPNTTTKVEITQKMGAVSLKQQLFADTRLSFDANDYWYNHDIQEYSLGLAQVEFLLNRRRPRVFNGISGTLNGVSGLVSGFPDWSLKFGVTQNIDALPVPVTLWANYQNTHYISAYAFAPPTLPRNSLATGVTSDSSTYGIDADAAKGLTVTAQYQHVRQTSQTIQDLYGLSLEKSF
jgi:hypothetical protein